MEFDLGLKKMLEEIIQKPPAQKKLHSTMQHKKPAAPRKDHHLRGLDLLDVEVASEFFLGDGHGLFLLLFLFHFTIGRVIHDEHQWFCTRPLPVTVSMMAYFHFHLGLPGIPKVGFQKS